MIAARARLAATRVNYSHCIDGHIKKNYNMSLSCECDILLSRWYVCKCDVLVVRDVGLNMERVLFFLNECKNVDGFIWSAFAGVRTKDTAIGYYTTRWITYI